MLFSYFSVKYGGRWLWFWLIEYILLIGCMMHMFPIINILMNSNMITTRCPIWCWYTDFRISIPQHKVVPWITVADNPKDKAQPYPGRFRRNHKQGVTITKEEWLQEQTHLWVKYMRTKPVYNKTYLSDKAKVLLSYLSRIFPNQHRNKRNYHKLELRKLHFHSYLSCIDWIQIYPIL